VTHRLAKAIAVLLFGPLLGILIGLILALLALPPDPNFVSNGGHASPGDGILVMGCLLFGFLISLVPSAALAVVMLTRPSESKDGNSRAKQSINLI